MGNSSTDLEGGTTNLLGLNNELSESENEQEHQYEGIGTTMLD